MDINVWAAVSQLCLDCGLGHFAQTSLGES